MARPSTTACTRATFTADVGCLQNFDLHQRKALMLYFNVLELAALGGTNYVAQLGPNGTLVAAAACNQTLEPAQKDLALLLINKNNADDAGATVPTTNAALMAAIACLQNQPEGMLDAMALHVQCLLGRHAAWPQVDL